MTLPPFKIEIHLRPLIVNNVMVIKRKEDVKLKNKSGERIKNLSSQFGLYPLKTSSLTCLSAFCL